MDRRFLRALWAGLVAVLLAASPLTALANSPSVSYDEGIYGSSDYSVSQTDESARLPDGFVDQGGGNTSAVPEPGTLVLMSVGLAFLSRRYLRRSDK